MEKLMFQCLAATSFLLLIILVAPSVTASAGWTMTYPGEEMDMLTPYSMVQTMNGGYVTAINAELRRVDNVGFPGHFSQSYELQILKTDQNGEVQWKRSYPTVDDPNDAFPPINA